MKSITLLKQHLMKQAKRKMMEAFQSLKACETLTGTISTDSHQTQEEDASGRASPLDTMGTPSLTSATAAATAGVVPEPLEPLIHKEEKLHCWE